MEKFLSLLSKLVWRLFTNKDISFTAKELPSNLRKLSREAVLNLIENNGGPEGLDLSYCEFVDVDLSNINFGGDWNVGTLGTNFEGSRFRHSNLEACNLDLTSFQNALVEITNLNKASLRAANCTNTNFRKSSFRYTNLYRSQLAGADFFETNLELADLYKAKNIKDALLDKSNFGNKILQETNARLEEYLAVHNLGNNEQVIAQRFRHASEIYLDLKNAFTQQGRYQDARWAYLKERRTLRSAINPLRVRKSFYNELDQRIRVWNWKWWWFYLRFTTKWILSWMEDFSCGYGELPPRAIVLSFVIILIFPIIYQQFGGVVGASTWLDYFNYSLGTFTTIGFNTFQATTSTSQTLTSMEAMMGISMLALLMYTLGNRISRS
jgi:uncharacterized protein YjbI with pentapeptide repeats